MRIKSLLLLIVGLVLAISSSTRMVDSALAVSTLAGSGRIELKNGPALRAGFLMPSGLAYGRHGRLYISDYAAQRIRVYRSGKVETIAGSGRVDPLTHLVQGGYRNGPARSARFNFPLGVAVGPDNAIYVADSQNHVIRRIYAGRVSTFAGVVTDDRGRDGPRGVGSFHDPLGLSFGPRGTLYVADYGVGLRAVSRDGAVRTVYAVPDTTGVSVVKDVRPATIWWCGLTQIRRSIPARGVDQRFPSAIQEGQGQQHFHTPFQIFAVSPKDALFSDLTSNTIRYYRLANIFEYTPLIRSLIGPDGEDLLNTGGFKDGAFAAAGANAPMGIAMAPDGTIVFADGGSGRIRTIRGFSTRHYIDPDLAGLGPVKGNPIRIAYVGNSYASWDVLWNESTGGVIEKRLNQYARLHHLKHRFRIDVLRSAGTSIPQELQQVTSMLMDSGFKGVVLGVNAYNDGTERTETSFGSVPAADRVRAAIAKARARLRKRGMFLIAVVHPLAMQLAPFERMVVRVRSNFPCVDRASLGYAIRFFQRLGVPTFDSTPAFSAYENRTRRFPLFGADDHHFTMAGNRVLGEYIAGTLEQLRPWSADKQAVTRRELVYEARARNSEPAASAVNCLGQQVNADFPGAYSNGKGIWHKLDGVISNSTYHLVPGQTISIHADIAKAVPGGLASISLITSHENGYYVQSYRSGTSIAVSRENIGSILGEPKGALSSDREFHSYTLTITPGNPSKIVGSIDKMRFAATDASIPLHGRFHVVIRTAGSRGLVRNFSVSDGVHP